MHRSFTATAFLTALAALSMVAGCVSPIAGTWQGRGDAVERPFSFGSVTFAGDGTFTAEARYGDTTRAVSGTWTMTGDIIMLYGEPFGERSYNVQEDKDMLVFTDPTTGKSMTLDRFK